jgi:dGTPase
LAKHRSIYDKPKDDAFSEANCSLEGQVAGIADRIAYNCHDLEDGMRAGLINSKGGSRTAPTKIQIFTEAQRRINANAIDDQFIRSTRTAKAIIDKLVSDCIDASNSILDARCSILDSSGRSLPEHGGNPESRIESVDDVYRHSENLIVLSAESEAALAELEKFLLANFYEHDSLLQTAKKVKKWLQQLFEMLCRKPQLMPAYFQRFIEKEGLQRTVCDYIAGMTDRFCLKMLEEI